MSQMSVEFSFDEEKLKQRGMNRKTVYAMLKKNFTGKGFVCISEGNVLAFGGTGKKEDYGRMWALIVLLTECDWFTECASHFVFVENNREENILPQIAKGKRSLAVARAAASA